MAYLVNANKQPAIDLAPNAVVDEVLQNVRTIITTIKGSVPLDRAFGIDGEVVDLPVNVAKAKLTNEIFRAVRLYEPRAVIESIDFEADLSGRLVPMVEVSINA